ncbi:DNA polymerase III subunit psi [Vibrio brasiliensis]|uniref:DNA polymerase III subunit psi n=1 Tax=Vibrio brasiliensis TaxID=170652 RepID=UPI001EFD91B5|nr:DNA polymerase III subunit psi [Vibrio brasiliensis]MCG9650226.1 DNA polymerase III subunit psi [Vibrio brasiliensis]MCG9727313.1 DNA polymerase III subunit psi [Vibrio brasiliensis]
MPQHEIEYLQEMGIQCYELSHPERLQGYQAPCIALQASCQLLLVSPQYPKNETAIMFEKVLKSINLGLEQAQHIYPQQVSQLAEHQLEWIWFAGCDAQPELEGKVLSSPLLSDIDGNNEQRRALWQQICSYK